MMNFGERCYHSGSVVGSLPKLPYAIGRVACLLKVCLGILCSSESSCCDGHVERQGAGLRSEN